LTELSLFISPELLAGESNIISRCWA